MKKIQTLTIDDVLSLGHQHGIKVNEKEANTAITLLSKHIHHLHSQEDIEHFFQMLEQSIGQTNTGILKKIVKPYLTLLF